MTSLDRPDVEGRSSGMPVPLRVSILLVRPLADEAPRSAEPEGVTLLLTHGVVACPDGIRDARAFPPDGAILVVSSRTTVDVLASTGLLAGAWREVIAAGEETARTLREAGANRVTAPGVPGAAGILALLPADLHGTRLLWPRGSDAATEPHAVLTARGAAVASPVVYEKRPLARLEGGVLTRLSAGGFDAVAVTSIAALDVLLAAIPAPPRSILWGVLGPETARLAVDRGLPAPVVPSRPRIPDLLALLMERAGESKR